MFRLIIDYCILIGKNSKSRLKVDNLVGWVTN